MMLVLIRLNWGKLIIFSMSDNRGKAITNCKARKTNAIDILSVYALSLPMPSMRISVLVGAQAVNYITDLFLIRNYVPLASVRCKQLLENRPLGLGVEPQTSTASTDQR